MTSPIPQNEFHLRRGDRTCRLLNGDCLKGIPDQIPDGTADVVVTSPPYNLGTAYSAYENDIPRGDYLDWTEQWISTVATALHLTHHRDVRLDRLAVGVS